MDRAPPNPFVVPLRWVSRAVWFGVWRRCSARMTCEGGRPWAEDSTTGVRDFGDRPCMCMLRPLIGAVIRQLYGWAALARRSYRV